MNAWHQRRLGSEGLETSSILAFWRTGHKQRKAQSRSRTGHLALGVPLICLAVFGVAASVPTVSEPEAEDLINRAEGTVLISQAREGIRAVRLPSLDEFLVRPAGASNGYAHSLSGPDAEGQIAFVENHMVERWHALKITSLNTSAETSIFRREGDALWGDAIGDHLSLSHQNSRVAFLSNLEGRQTREPMALYREGTIEIWDIEAREILARRSPAIDRGISLFPDGRRVAYVALVDAGSSEASDDRWERELRHGDVTLAVHLWDIETDEVQMLHPGELPMVSPDGESLLLQGGDGWRLMDLATGEVRDVAPPGDSGLCFALLGEDIALYRGLPTEGTPIQYSTTNSPLRGPQPLWPLKLTDLNVENHQTVIPHIDYRWPVSFGMPADPHSGPSR